MKAIEQEGYKSIWKFFGCVAVIAALICSFISVPAIPAFIISSIALISAGILFLSAEPDIQYKEAASPVVAESNRRAWISFLRPSKKAGKQIIQDFFIRDNISFQLFKANAAENETIDLLPVVSQKEDLTTALYVTDNNNELADCTNTFKKYYAENRLNRISFS